jgi:uncharacterized protein YcbK (DUF882 family)
MRPRLDGPDRLYDLLLPLPLPCRIASMQDRSRTAAPSARRRTLQALGLASLSLALPFSRAAWAAVPRSISLYHTHTGERLNVVYFASGAYVGEAVAELNRMLRDFRTGEVCDIDVRLFDQLHALNLACGAGRFEVISAFRSVRTNAMLHSRSDGVATNSLHTSGRAIDVRLTGLDTRRLRDAAIALGGGGVGFYAQSDFVHLDTGRPRTW